MLRACGGRQATCYQPPGGLRVAVGSRVGNALGGGDIGTARTAWLAGLALVSVWIAVPALLLSLLPRPWALVFTDDEARGSGGRKGRLLDEAAPARLVPPLGRRPPLPLLERRPSSVAAASAARLCARTKAEDLPLSATRRWWRCYICSRRG